jgi:ATP-dependent Lhr-like helicase
VKGEGVTAERIHDVIERLATAQIWEDTKLWKDVAESLPNYRLSKFQDLMPEWVEQEEVADYLLAVPGAKLWLSQPIPGTQCQKDSHTHK